LPAIALKKPEKFILKESLIENFKQVRVGLKSRLLPYFVMMGIWAYAIANNQIAIPLLGVQKFNLSAWQVSLLFAMMGFGSVLVQAFLIGKISRKYGEERTFKIGLLLMAAAIFMMSFSPTVVFLTFMIVAMAFGSALSRPTLNSIISKLAVEGQGTTMGIAVSFEAIGRILGPAAGGYLFQKFNGFGPFWVSAFVIVFFLTLYNRNYIFSFLKPRIKVSGK
ncbi:MAG: MFS transporter, partial [Candidatus Nealsonbacteria bacterium]